jgi:hypothetical protein
MAQVAFSIAIDRATNNRQPAPVAAALKKIGILVQILCNCTDARESDIDEFKKRDRCAKEYRGNT